MIKVKTCTNGEFINKVSHGEKLVCISAGERLKKLCFEFRCVENIVAVVDNYRVGEKFAFDGCEIDIISLEESAQYRGDCQFIVTTDIYAAEILAQLDSESCFDGQDVYFYAIFEHTSGSRIPEKYLNNYISKIPKKIHYCWFGNSKMPKKFQENIDSWKKHCPDYEIIQWNERNYDVTKNRYMKQAYDAKKWGFVPDYARLDIINQHGGVYLDTDVQVVRSFNELLQFDLFCGFEDTENVNFGAGFGGIANNMQLRSLMSVYDEVLFQKEDGTLNLLPSPKYQTEVMKRFGFVMNGETQIINNVAVLSSVYFSPIRSNGIGNVTEDTYSIHQYAATWFDDQQYRKKKKLVDICLMLRKRVVEC